MTAKRGASQDQAGSGKSTFLHCLSGLLRPTEGDISYKGRSLTLDMSDADLDVFSGPHHWLPLSKV